MSYLAIAGTNLLYVFAVAIPFLFYRSDYGYCHPLVLNSGFLIIFSVPRSLPFMLNGLTFHTLLPGYNRSDLLLLYAYSTFVDSVAILAIYGGFYLFRNYRGPNWSFERRPNGLFYPVVLVSILVGGIAMYLFASRFGGFYNYLLSLTKGASAMLQTDVVGVGQFVVPVIGASVAVVLWIVVQRNALINPAFWVAAISVLVMSYATTGKRTSIIAPIITLGLAWIVVHRRMPFLRVLLVGVLCFALLGVLGMFRWANQSREVVSFDFVHDLSVDSVFSATSDELERRTGAESTYYAILARVPDDVGFLWGKSYLENIYRFIPRFFWPSKPRGIDVQAAYVFAGATWGMPPGAVGEAYWNLHLFGVIIVFGLMGVIYRVVGTWFLRCPDSPAMISFYILTMQYLDPSQNGFRQWIHTVIPLLLICAVVGLLRKRSLSEIATSK